MEKLHFLEISTEDFKHCSHVDIQNILLKNKKTKHKTKNKIVDEFIKNLQSITRRPKKEAKEFFTKYLKDNFFVLYHDDFINNKMDRKIAKALLTVGKHSGCFFSCNLHAYRKQQYDLIYSGIGLIFDNKVYFILASPKNVVPADNDILVIIFPVTKIPLTDFHTGIMTACANDSHPAGMPTSTKVITKVINSRTEAESLLQEPIAEEISKKFDNTITMQPGDWLLQV